MNVVILINFFIYLLQTVYCWKKHPNTIYFYFWLYFCIFAGASVFIVSTGIYELRFYNLTHNRNLVITPYLICFICVYMLLYPFKSLENSSLLLERKTLQKFTPLVKIICAVMVIYFLIKLYEYSLFSRYSILERREMSVGGEGFVNRGRQAVLWYSDFLLWMIHDITTPFLVLYMIQGYIRNLLSMKRFAFITLCVILPQLLTFWITSNRSGIFYLIINLIFFSLIYKRYIPTRKFKKLIKYAVLFAVPFAIALSLISSVRYENSDISIQNGIFSYFGESFPNLGSFVYDQNNRITMGARLFPDYFNQITGISFKIDGGLKSYHEFWTNYTGAYIHVFKTVFGDLYLEFGTYGAILVIAIIAILAYLAFKKNRNYFFRMGIVYLYICFCTNSVLDFGLIFGRFYVPRYVLGCFLLGIYINKKYKLSNMS